MVLAMKNRSLLSSLSLLGSLSLILATCSLASGQAAVSSPSSAKPPVAEGTLDSRVKAELASFKGKVSLFAKNLDTGQTYEFGADDRVRTASTIKIAIMVEAFARVAEGKAKWTDELILSKAARYGGSGGPPGTAAVK